MQKDGSIIIGDFNKGIGESALFGAEAIVGMDIFDEPGILKIKDAGLEASDYYNTILGFDKGILLAETVNENGIVSNTTDTGLIIHNDAILTGPFTKGWDCLTWDNDFTVYSYVEGGSGKIGIVSRKTGSAVWHAAKITSLTATHYIKLLKAQDGYIYFTNGRYIGRITNISEAAGVVTVTSTSNALDLTLGVYATTICELGGDLLVGAQKGLNYEAKVDFQFANIYKWDRTSSSFRLPMQVNEFGINAMLQKDNQVYFSAGVWGNIYVTDGTNFQKIKTLPFAKVKKFGVTSTVYPNAMCINQAGNLLVGLSTYVNNLNDGSTKFGVYEIFLTQGYPATLSYSGLDGDVGGDSLLLIGYVSTLYYNYLRYGMRNYDGGNVDKIMISNGPKNTNFRASYESQYYIVGTRSNRKTYQTLEFLLLEPLVDGQFIEFSYRKGIDEAWSEITSIQFGGMTGVSHLVPAVIADAELLQIRVRMSQTNGSSTSNVKLLRIILR